MNVFVAGYPKNLGGAQSELWHCVKLWRQHGVEVTLIPTWSADPQWRCRTAAVGCKTLDLEQGDVSAVVSGQIVVAFCNVQVMGPAFNHAKVVFASCMSYPMEGERAHYLDHPPFAKYIFQSRYQWEQLLPHLNRHAIPAERCHLIRGAFDTGEFPYRPKPHSDGEFVVGRMSRPHPWKYSEHTWDVFDRIRQAIDAPVRVRVMGWESYSARTAGAAPDWAEVLPPCAETPQQFLTSLHAMVQLEHKPENWPRTGLEAMSIGVPVVVLDRGGWREMLEHGVSGYLCRRPEEAADYCKRLQEDEGHRMRMAANARGRLEDDLAEPDLIWLQWRKVFESLA